MVLLITRLTSLWENLRGNVDIVHIDHYVMDVENKGAAGAVWQIRFLPCSNGLIICEIGQLHTECIQVFSDITD